ncbi:hypothetical protein M199_gp234 [Halogranum tailed virus 1]|uniref:Uncharacterized protein n=1 Tax=Halogranum tailed virus 1 TaxID=1273749 RepID=R4TL85_9CAUD|nr:hypothetical protein M199_gp234 [Halogranum tailed virus 1]AGM11432.1 hypothetical protein HGTV1_134 [Halogranum tailed virus 1]
MGFKDSVTEEVKQARENSGSDEQETLEQIEVDMGSTAFVHFHPTTILTGTFPEDEGNPIIRFPDAQHNEGRLDQGYLGLVLDDPGVVADAEEGTEGTVIVDVADSNEVRVFNADDKGTDVLDGVGVEYGDRLYKGEVVDSFDADRIIAVVSGTASTSVAKKLDVNGAENAGMDEETGQVNGGLIEYPNGADADVSSRYARNPELREELYGTEVGVMVARREELDEEYAEMVENEERRAMKWFSVFADLGDGFEPLSPTEGTPVGYSYLEWNFDPSVGSNRLPDEDYEFVQEYVEAGMPTDEDTIRTNIEDNGGSLSDDPNVDRMVELIQNQS